MHRTFHSVKYAACLTRDAKRKRFAVSCNSRGHTRYCGLVRGPQVQNNNKCIQIIAQITVHVLRLYKHYECERGPNNINRQAAGYETNDIMGSLTLFDFNQSWKMCTNFTETPQQNLPWKPFEQCDFSSPLVICSYISKRDEDHNYIFRTVRV
jgi:hypothetical protein